MALPGIFCRHRQTEWYDAGITFRIPQTPLPDNAMSEIESLLHLLDAAYDHKAWHGPNLRGALRGVTQATAAWRPAPQRHNIWEIALHAAYWKASVRRRLLGAKRGSFPLKGSNWFPRPDATFAADWKSDLALLGEMHRQLRETVAALLPSNLDKPAPGDTAPSRTLITGIAFHDVYHAGQIQTLKRLAAAK